jgi:subtilisin-like proprotein convertase family protein
MSWNHKLKSCAYGVAITAAFFLPKMVATAEGKYCTDLTDRAKNPLGVYQWHLKNTGQTSFATDPGVAGEDINVWEAQSVDCLSGDGVSVAVVDTGLELAHPSLNLNIDDRPFESKTWSINFRNDNLRRNDPSPLEEDGDDHGTMVAGIIAMRSNLGFGGTGVAPHASLSGYNIINNDTQSFSNFADSLGGSDASRNNDIFSMSYGYNSQQQLDPDTDTTLYASLSAYRWGTRNLRGGKGALYVKAAGNGFYRLGMGACPGFKFGLTCQNSSMDPDNAMPEVITVSAMNAKGKKTSYSTVGSSVWVAAPGGEFGFNRNWIDQNRARLGEKPVDWKSYRATLGEPAIVTTDMMGLRAGMSKQVDLNDTSAIFDIRNEFNACQPVENLNCNYTNSMNGTSSATPVTSGSLAVVLEANPNLTWRDVKHILAVTSTKVDPAQGSVELDLSGGKYIADQGWVKNAAGYSFSNWYGFGRVNVTDAAHYAATHYDENGVAISSEDNLGQYIETNWFPDYNAANLDVAKGNPTGITQTIAVLNQDDLVVESVQVKVSVTSTALSDVGFELTSPSGTKSIIWNVGNGFSPGSLKDQVIQSNAFYGEKSAGKWTLRIVNAGLTGGTATFKGWKMRVVGHKASFLAQAHK